MKITFTDQEIITKIQKGGKDFEDASMHLFHEFQGLIVTIIQKVHLSKADAQDAYADALVKLIRHIKDERFRGESKISSYFYRIFYNTSVDVFRKNTSNKNITTEELHEYNAKERDLMNMIADKDQAKHVIQVIDEMSTICKAILIDWAYYGYSMNDIAKRSNLSNPESARSMKYKCLKKLRLLLSDKLYEL